MFENMDNANNKKKAVRAEIYLNYAGYFFAIAGFSFFMLNAKNGLSLFSSDDEIEKFVAAQMINQGLHLYRDIFAHHGPIPYIISHLYVLIVNQSDFSYIRISQAFIAILASLALIFSPILKNFSVKVWVIGAYFFLLSSVWVLQSLQMITYQSIGGFLLLVPCAQLFVPLFFDEKPNKYGLFASGVTIILACFTAYSYGPSCFLLLAASLVLVWASRDKTDWETIIKPTVMGMLLALLIAVTWLFVFADLKGFFIYHFYFNQQIYSEFIDFSPARVFDVFLFSLLPHEIIHSVALFFFCFWVFMFLASIIKWDSTSVFVSKCIALLLFISAVLFANPRGGSGFHESAFVVVNFALFVLTVGWFLQRSFISSSHFTTGGSVLILILAITFTEHLSGYAISSPHRIGKADLNNYTVQMKPERNRDYDLIRSLTKKEGDLLALIYTPMVYIKAGRLPASGHFYYLPWQAAYNKNPIGDHKIDICSDLASYKPAIIRFDNWKVWWLFSIEDYEPCIPNLIKADYSPLDLLGGAPWFIRNDLLPIDSATINRFKQDIY